MVFEPTFLLMYYSGFTYSEAYDLYFPVAKWFIERINKELSKGDGSQTSRATQHNTPAVRKFLGMERENVPSRLRRQT